MGKGKMQGFTLVEVVVVIVILSVLSGIASLVADLIRKERVASVTRMLYADMQKARLDAMTRDAAGYGLRFESSGSYSVFTFNDCNNDFNYDSDTCDGNSREEANVITRPVPDPVVLKKTNPFTDFDNDILLFDRFGVPRRETWGLGMMTIIVKNGVDGEGIKCVSVSANRIREGIWSWDKKERKYTCIEQ